jgi:hypothetical protein
VVHLNLGLLATASLLLTVPVASADPIPIPGQDETVGPAVGSVPVDTPEETIPRWCFLLTYCRQNIVTQDIDQTVEGQDPMPIGTPAIGQPRVCIPPEQLNEFICLEEGEEIPSIPLGTTPAVDDVHVEQEIEDFGALCNYVDWAADTYLGVEETGCRDEKDVPSQHVGDTPVVKLRLRYVVAPDSYVDAHAGETTHIGPQQVVVNIPPIQAPNGGPVVFEGYSRTLTYCASGCDVPRSPSGHVDGFLELTTQVGPFERVDVFEI